MTPDEMITHMRSLIGGYDEYDTNILTELQNAQTALEGRGTLPWFLLQEAYTDTEAGEPRVPVPSNFRMEYEDSALWYVDDDGDFNRLAKGHQDDLRAYWDKEGSSDEDTEGPRAYALVGQYFHLYPTPSAVYRIRMYYYKHDDTLLVGGDANQWSTHFPDLLMGMAGQNMVLHTGHLFEEKQIALGRFSSMAAAGERRLLGKITARELENMELSYGGG